MSDWELGEFRPLLNGSGSVVDSMRIDDPAAEDPGETALPTDHELRRRVAVDLVTPSLPEELGTRIHHSLSDLVGNTPLLELHNYAESRGLCARIVAKLEYLNPAGSIKDRVAWSIIKDAEASRALHPGDLIVDVTSGNTGIGLAAVAAARGYRTKFYLSDNISPDKIKVLQLYGAEIVTVKNDFFLAPDALDKIAAQIRDENPAAVFTDQLANPANPRAHFDTTGPEIWRDTDGTVDILVGGVGTGGTISGAGKFLKLRKPGLRVVIAEPAEASVPNEDNPYPDEIDGVHKVSEVPPEQLPKNFDHAVVDEIIPLSTAQARATALALVAEEGVFAGTSSGAVLWAATQLASRSENAGKLIVAVLPDSGERYLASTLLDARDHVHSSCSELSIRAP